ncbi:hypothetical protein ABW20_dc0103999 [Dactylellina cionopaga]|nr:hypothetical protein ABW20_dc0103999 [Dactylellina cionopaga]
MAEPVVRHVYFAMAIYQRLPIDTLDSIHPHIQLRSLKLATSTPPRPRRAAPCSGSDITLQTERQRVSIESNRLATMKDKDRQKERRPSRRQSVFSIASSYFGPTALGSDISLDRQISPALQTSHVFFGEETYGGSPSRSPFSLSRNSLRENHSPTSPTSPTAIKPQGLGLPCLTSPRHPSPPAPSLVPSAQLTPAISGRSSSSSSGTTTPGTGYSGDDSGKRRTSKRSSKSFFSTFPTTRKSSVANFMGRVRDLPSRFFHKNMNKDLYDPAQPRSTCPITSDQISPPSPSQKRKPTKSEKAALKRKKSADKYIQKKTKKRLREFKREMKRRMSDTEEAKEARKRMGKTEKMLKVMDDAKEKFWEWLDRRDEKRRRKQTRAYTAMREERRKSVLEEKQ